MANTIKIRRSATQGAVPTTSQLSLGELAINTYDGKLFLKKDDGTESIVEVSGSGGASDIGSLTDVTVASVSDGQFLQYNATNSAWENTTFVSGGTAATVIAPFAHAYVDTASAGSGTNISWGAWTSNNGEVDFTFATTQANADYSVVTDNEWADDIHAQVINKSTTGFTLILYSSSQNESPASKPVSVFVYAPDPTITIGGTGAANLNDLADVVSPNTPTDGQQLVYLSSAGGWTAAFVSNSIQNLNNVDINNLVDGQILQWNATSSQWENETLPAGTTDLSYDSATRVLSSSTGTDATIPEVVAGGDSGLMTGADKTKLDGLSGGSGSSGGLEIREVQITVTSNSKFAIQASEQANQQVISGATYRFNQLTTSNTGHPFALSTTEDGTHGGGSKWTNGWTYTGTAGVDGVGEFTVPFGVNRLYYYCEQHPNMGGIIEVVHLYRTDLFDDHDTRYEYVERAEVAASSETIASPFYTLNELIKNDSGQSNDSFGNGCKISTDGNWLIVGEPFSDELAINAGAWYVYKKQAGSGWKVFHREPYSAGTAYYGTPVAISGDGRFVAAAALNNTLIRIFERDDVTGKYDPRSSVIGWNGFSIAFNYDGTRLFTGDYLENSSDGAVRFYEWVDYDRGYQLKSTITPPTTGEEFGMHLDVSRDGRSLVVTYRRAYRFGVYDIDDAGVITEVQTTLLQNTTPQTNTEYGRAFGVRMADNRQLIAFGNPYGFATTDGGVEIWTRAKSTFDPTDPTSTFTHAYDIEEPPPQGGYIKLGYDIELSADGLTLFAADPYRPSYTSSNLLRNIKVYKLRGLSAIKLHEFTSSGVDDDTGFADENAMTLSGDAETLIIGFAGKDASDVTAGVYYGFLAEYRQQRLATAYATGTSLEIFKNTNISGNVDITGEYRVNGVAISTGGGGSGNVEDLGNVTIANTIQAGHYLRYDGTDWHNRPSSVILSENTIDDFSDFNINGDIALNDGDIIQRTSLGEWMNKPLTLSIHTDVDLTTAATNGQTLVYNSTSTKWEPGTSSVAVSDLTEVAAGSPSGGDVIQYNGTSGAWEVASAPASGITVKQAQGDGGTVDVTATSVTEIVFDANTGFSVTDNTGSVFVSLGSSFKTWYVNGQTTLIADGEDEIEFIAGTGVTLSTTTSHTGSATKALTINSTAQDGTDGDAATIQVGTVTTLAAGSSATITNSGTTSAAVFDFGIPRGTDGSPGTPGTDGNDATIAIGNVTTGAAGSSAAVSNSGTATAAVFDFSIPQGDDGTAATITVGSVTTGASGSSATVTNSGTSNAAVLDFTIPKGDEGPATVSVGTVTTGAAGTSASVTNSGTQSAAIFDFTIPKGDSGTDGNDATVSVGTVTTGAAGSSASVTNSGTSGAAVFDFTIPKGDTGTPGTDGEDGVDGDAATIQVGTVTTGAAGSSASVSNSGTSNAAVLDFTIPKGDDGAATVSIGSVTTGNAGSSATVTNSGTQTAAVLDFSIPKGDQGNPGTSSTIAIGNVATGAAGTNAAVSNSGTASAAVLDFTIPRGADGSPGSPGSAATVSVGTVTTLSAGSSVTVTNSGTSNAAVLDFGIPQGPDGAATVSIGTVTTGAAGTNASVTNSGTNTAAVLDFTIPRGDPGTGGGGGGVDDSTAIAYAIALS